LRNLLLQKGIVCIKHVLPALIGKSYNGLSIAKRDDATLTFSKMVTGSLKETVQARKNLSLDTLRMIWVVEALGKFCRS